MPVKTIDMKLGSHFLLFVFFLCYGIGSCSFSLAEKTSSNYEISALSSIKSGLIDPLNRLRDWKLPDNGASMSLAHCNWTGVRCNSDGAVEELDLSYMNLTGRVSDDIGQLKHLSSLNLCCNDLRSALPETVATLTSLNSIDVSQNSFSGSFPVGFGSVFGLTLLNASSNSFTGVLPEDLGNVSSLETLDLRGNFFQGSVPKSFKDLQKLKFLGLSGNNLTGQIPGELGQLSSLETMIML